MQIIKGKPGTRDSGKIEKDGIAYYAPSDSEEAVAVYGEEFTMARFLRGFRIYFNAKAREFEGTVDELKVLAADEDAFAQWMTEEKPRGRPRKPPTVKVPEGDTISIAELQALNPNLKIVTA